MTKTMSIKGTDLFVKYNGKTCHSNGDSEIMLTFDDGGNVISTTQVGKGGMQTQQCVSGGHVVKNLKYKAVILFLIGIIFLLLGLIRW